MNARRKLLVAIGAFLLTKPLVSLGQLQSKVARIGYLAASFATDNAHYAQVFREALHDLGYVLLQLKGEVIATFGAVAAVAAKSSTTTVRLHNC